MNVDSEEVFVGEDGASFDTANEMRHASTPAHIAVGFSKADYNLPVHAYLKHYECGPRLCFRMHTPNTGKARVPAIRGESLYRDAVKYVDVKISDEFVKENDEATRQYIKARLLKLHSTLAGTNDKGMYAEDVDDGSLPVASEPPKLRVGSSKRYPGVPVYPYLETSKASLQHVRFKIYKREATQLGFKAPTSYVEFEDVKFEAEFARESAEAVKDHIESILLTRRGMVTNRSRVS